MNEPSPILARAAFYCAFGSAVASLFSIAVCQILLALSVAALLVSGTRLRFPPIWLPLVLFMGLTVASLLFSGDPAAGRPQIRKFFVYLVLLVTYSAFRHLGDVRRLVLAWAGAGALAAAWGLAQFIGKLEAARPPGESFYRFYVSERITGPLSHWMTFSGLLMMVLLLLVAFLFFSPSARGIYLWLGLACAAVLGLAVLLGITRSVWLATAASGVYLLWFRDRRWLAVLPVALVVVWAAGPRFLRTRVASGFEPQKQVDSNQHRIVCWRTGWVMIQAHPWLGLGPEIVKRDFLKWVPPDIPRPLPEGWYGHLHSIYIHYAAERGVPAMLVLVWLLVKILRDFLHSVLRLPPGPSEEKFVLHGGIAVVLAIMIAGIFELNLGDSEVLTMFLAVVACGYLAVEKTRAVDAGHA